MHDGAHICKARRRPPAPHASACHRTLTLPATKSKLATRASTYKTQIVAEGQKRVDVASVVQTKKGDPLPCDRPHCLSLEASSAIRLRPPHTSTCIRHRPCERGRGARPITRVHKASCPESTRRAPTSVVSHSQGKTEGLARGPRVRAHGGEPQSDQVGWNGP